MKPLILTLLISFSSFAQTLVTIKPNDSKLASMQLEEKTLNKAIKKLKKLVLKSSWLKGSFGDDQSGHIFSDKNKSPLGANVTQYFIPSNFTVIITDITAEMAVKEEEKNADKVLRGEVRKMNFKKKTSETVGEWRDRIGRGMNRLRKLVRE